MDMMETLRWGVVGTGSAAEQFADALQSDLTTFGHKIVAVASRDRERCKDFAAKHNIQRFYGNYKDLAEDEQVEVVYVAVLNPQHYDVCLLMLRNGKHVLCAAPFCMNRLQTEKTLEYAQYNELLVLGGYWERFFPTYRYFRNMIESNEIYDIREVYVRHGLKCDTKDRVIRKSLGGGVVLDLGGHAIQFVLLCFNEYPKSIKVSGKINSYGVDMHFEAELMFSGGRFAKIVCSGLETIENQAVVISKKGTVCFPSYYCPLSLIEPDCSIRTWWIPETDKYSNSTNSSNYLGLRYEADEVGKCIRKKKIFSKLLTPEEMIMIARIQDEIRRQIGVRYECDKK